MFKTFSSAIVFKKLEQKKNQEGITNFNKTVFPDDVKIFEI